MLSVEKLLSKSIPELRELFLGRRRPVPKGLLEALEIDTRQGAHHLARQIRVRYRSNRSEGQRLHALLRFEIELWLQGFALVAGVDEAGMAPLAGPVVAGAVILPQHYKLDRKSTRLNSSHDQISYAVFCLKKKKKTEPWTEKRIVHNTSCTSESTS